MQNYKIHLMVLGAVSTNCYILYGEDTKKAVVFDPADRADAIAAKIEELGLQLESVSLPHVFCLSDSAAPACSLPQMKFQASPSRAYSFSHS